jgi:hypothetical protein
MRDSVTARTLIAEGLEFIASDPSLLNRGLESLRKRPGFRLLEDLNLRAVSFEAADSDARGLGFAYDLEKDLARSTFRQTKVSHTGLAATLKANGNVAVDRRINPRDFLVSDFSVHWYGSRGGVWPGAPTTAAERTRLNQLEDSVALIADPDALRASPAMRELVGFIRSRLTTHLYWDLAGSARIESDQDFDEKQNVLGATVGAVLDVPHPVPMNLFDWPAAALRYLSGYDPEFSPRGSSLPSLQVELATVKPDGDSVRTASGDTRQFMRVRLEAGMRSPVFGKPDGNRIFLDAGYRLYQELGASRAAKAADIDQFSYFVAALVSSTGPYASYSTGRLPFDRRNDQVYELGFKFDF